MTLFWLASAVLIALALLFLLPPLLRRRTVSAGSREMNVRIARQRLGELERESADGVLDPGLLETARDELSRELLLDVEHDAGDDEPLRGRRDLVAVAAVSLVLPLLAFTLYLNIGDRDAVRGVPRAPQAGASEAELPSVEEMVTRLEQRLREQPDDASGWLMLGRGYGAMERWDDAGEAYARALDLAPESPDVMVEYAATLARGAQGSLEGRPAQLLAEALALAPDNLNASFLMGHVHFQAGRFAEALAQWERVAAGLPPDGEDMRQLQVYIAEARQRLGAPVPAGTPAASTAGTSAIEVHVALDPALADSVAPGDTLFVYARATEGPRMPLAIARHPASALPLTVTLDESMGMMANLSLASFEQVTVEARVSRTGNAMPQSGDLRGTLSPVSPRSGEPVEILIDSRVP